MTTIALYIHIPFCETKCPYCDFNTYARIEPLIPDYVAALRKEIALWGELLGHPEVRTVFLGGGTPSYLPAEDIGAILDSARTGFDMERAGEITLETNPGDLTPSKLQTYLDVGVDRLSIGVQSLDDRLLELLGRRHSAAQAVEAFRIATEAGLQNVSIDLMYGLPHQALDDWRTTLLDAMQLDPNHLSLYCLTLEKGTPMEQRVGSGLLPAPDADLAADMYLLAEDELASRGYRHYEISNWARPGMESRHNLTYWRNLPFLGVGPGAHSYLGGRRFSNLRSPRDYVRRLEPVTSPPASDDHDGDLAPLDDLAASVPVVDAVEPMDARLEMAETMMLGLRLDTGVSVAEFEERFAVPLRQQFADELDEMETAGLLEAVDGSVRLTQRGRLLGNEVFSRFF